MKLTQVDHDPFAAPAKGPTLTPVDYDPFASDEPVSVAEQFVTAAKNVPFSWGEAIGGLMQRYGDASPEADFGRKMLRYKNAEGIVDRSIALGEAIIAGIGAIPRLLLTEDEILSEGRARKAVGELGKTVSDYWNEKQKPIPMPEKFTDDPVGAVTGYTAEALQGAAGSLAPSLAVALATKNPTLGAAVMAPQVAGQDYADKRREGMDPMEARALSNFNALAEFIPEASALTEMIKPAVTILGRIMRGASQEAWQEAQTALLQDAIDHPEWTPEERAQSALYAAGLGAIGGAAVNSVMGEKPAAAPPPPEAEYEQSKAKVSESAEAAKKAAEEAARVIDEGLQVDEMQVEEVDAAAPPAETAPTLDEELFAMSDRMNAPVTVDEMPITDIEAAPAPGEEREPLPREAPAGGIKATALPVEEIEAAPAPQDEVRALPPPAIGVDSQGVAEPQADRDARRRADEEARQQEIRGLNRRADRAEKAGRLEEAMQLRAEAMGLQQQPADVAPPEMRPIAPELIEEGNRALAQPAPEVTAPAAPELPIFTGRADDSGDGWGASRGSISEGTKQTLLVDSNGNYFWGDRRLASGRDVGRVVEGRHKDFEPAKFASTKEAREAAAKVTATEPTAPAAPAKAEKPTQFTDEAAEAARRVLREKLNQPMAGKGKDEPEPEAAEMQKAIALGKRAKQARDRYAQESQVDPQKDDVLAAIAKMGGWSREEAKAQGIDPANFGKRGWKVKRVFTNGGDTADGLAERLAQFGYPALDDQGNYDANKVLDIVSQALAGNKVGTAAYNESQAELRLQEMQADQPAEDEDPFASYEPRYEPEVYDGLESAEEEALFDAARAATESGMPEDDIEAFLERAAIQGLTNDEIRQALDEARTERERVSRGAAAEEAPRQEAAPELLQSYDAQDLERLKAEEAARAQAAKDAEQKAAADEARGSFTLTGSNRPTDELTARGQGGLFDAPAASRSTRDQPAGVGTKDNAGISQSASDRILAAADLFGDNANAQAARIQGFDSLDREIQHVVLAKVRAALNDKQVLRSIVETVPVDVMNLLAGSEGAPKDFFHDQSVFAHRLSIPRDEAIPRSVARFIDALAAAVERGSAGGAAEDSALTGASTRNLSDNGGAARETRATDLWHGEIAGRDVAIDVSPTEGQKEAGNYRKGSVRIGGLDLSIENPAGSKRRPEWPTLKSHYGYIKGTVGKDKDHIDVFIRPGTPADWSSPVYVIDQIDPKTGQFDEHKVMIGYGSAEEARAAYLENYTKGWDGLKEITESPLESFKEWLNSGFTKKEFADYDGAVKRNAERERRVREAEKPEITIKDVPPAIVRRTKVEVQQLWDGEMRTQEVSAKEALDDLNREIAAFKKLADCVKGS